MILFRTISPNISTPEQAKHSSGIAGIFLASLTLECLRCAPWSVLRPGSSSRHKSSHLSLAVKNVTQTFLLSAAIWLLAVNLTAQETLDETSVGFLKTHCLHCHDGSSDETQFRLDNLATDFANSIVARKWEEVRFRINAGEMPPPEEPQPTAKEIEGVVDAITTRIRAGAAARMAQRGLVEHYRLSRQEYAHTVYDLLGVVFDVEAPGAFNEDPRWHGFERIGALLSTAPSHIDRYFNAANAVVDLALPDAETSSETIQKSAGEGKRQLLQLGEGWPAFTLRKPGNYRVKIHASGLPAFTGRTPRLSLWHSSNRSMAGIDLETTVENSATIEFTLLLPAGGYEIRNHARTQKHPNGAYRLFSNKSIDASQPLSSLKGGVHAYQTKVVDEQGRPVMPLLLIDRVEVEGPITTNTDQKKREGLIPVGQVSNLASDPQQVENLLQESREYVKRFAERAWRRPVSDAEIEPYVLFIASEQEAGVEFRSAYKSALSSMLVARSFFNLEEGSPNENRKQVNDFELANRLSYFLWSSMPDEQLFAAARSGELTTSEKLATEFDRMIADPKIDRFLDSFPRQWLQLHRVGMFQPDPNLYPDYDPWLEESMVMETTAYFAEMFRKNLPLREAVDSNWTMLNSRLAIHYGLPKPPQTELARVQLSPQSLRGGILTHASILSLSSDGTRHRPVHRGAWVSEAIFGTTPPPPPPNVEPLEPVKTDQPKTTIRSQLEAHATTPNCVSCHAKIDPLGLAFENFDAIGRWRQTEHVEGGIGKNPPVDASGILPDGRSFAGPAEFKKLLAENDQKLAEAFIEQLATYGLRRVMTVDDLEQIRSIVASTKAHNYGLQSLIRALVMSELFQQR